MKLVTVTNEMELTCEKERNDGGGIFIMYS